MRGPTLPSLFVALAVVALVAGSARRAEAAPTRQACVAAYEETQVSMRRSRLLAAKASLVTCLDDACPAVLRTDCAGWLKEVEARTPSVVVECSADGVDVRDMHLLVDGAPNAAGSDGKAMDLDPGTHSFRVEPPGMPPLTVEAFVREGDKLKVVHIDLPTTHDKPIKEPGPPVEGGGGKPLGAEELRRPVPWTVYAAGGVGLAAAAGFSVFALSGSAGKGDLEPCKPNCSAEQISDVRQQFIIADVLLGVSVLALGTASVLFFTRPTVSTRVGARQDPLLRALSLGAFAF